MAPSKAITTIDGVAEKAVPVKIERQDRKPGIYWGLDEALYHADKALGSSDMKRLSYSPADWWWQSKWNPMWEPDVLTPALIKGRAAHTCVLEGRDKFESLYGRKTLNFSTVEGKKQRQFFEEEGWTPLDAADYDRTLIIGEVIRRNPFIDQAFAGSVGTEVSVFWTRDGIKRKARFDCLKVKAIVDLKNISNDKNISFPQACLRYIDNYQAHIQCAHYWEGRLAMRALFDAGLVFGEDYDERLLEQAVRSPEFAWVFIFMQSTGAPLTWATQLSYKAERQWLADDGEIHTDPGMISEFFQLGNAAIARADKNWQEYAKRYGLDGTPWLLQEPIQELDLSVMPSWFSRNAEGGTL